MFASGLHRVVTIATRLNGLNATRDRTNDRRRLTITTREVSVHLNVGNYAKRVDVGVRLKVEGPCYLSLGSSENVYHCIHLVEGQRGL